MPEMKKYLYILAAVLLSTGCFHDFHEKMDGHGQLAVSLQWALSEDAGTSVHNLAYAIAGTGTSFTQFFAGPAQASSELLLLPAGEYDILVTVNMTGADGYAVEGLPVTKAGAGLSDIPASLQDPASSPEQAWYAFTHVDVQEGGVTVAPLQLKRLLATLDVDIDNIPAGTKMDMDIASVAQSVNLVSGAPSTDSKVVSHSAGRINILPTAAGVERFLLTLTLTTPDGNTLTVEGNVPRADVGKTYTLEMDYNTLQPYMNFSAGEIGPWGEKWTVSGEILNPRN